MKEKNLLALPSYARWKYYNSKKTIARDFDWFGFARSVTIVFLIVFLAAQYANALLRNYQ